MTFGHTNPIEFINKKAFDLVEGFFIYLEFVKSLYLFKEQRAESRGQKVEREDYRWLRCLIEYTKMLPKPTINMV